MAASTLLHIQAQVLGVPSILGVPATVPAPRTILLQRHPAAHAYCSGDARPYETLKMAKISTVFSSKIYLIFVAQYHCRSFRSLEFSRNLLLTQNSAGRT